MDLLVITPEEVEDDRDNLCTIVSEILSTGNVVYGTHETPEGLRASVAEDLRTAQIIKQTDDELVSIICFHIQQ